MVFVIGCIFSFLLGFGFATILDIRELDDLEVMA